MEPDSISSPETAVENHPQKSQSTNFVQLVFGVLLIITPLIFVVQAPKLISDAQLYLRVISALGAGLVGAAIPGVLKINLPGGVRAVGAAAFFAAVFFINPPLTIQAGGGGSLATTTITIGGKDFLESSIALELMSQAVESSTSTSVIRKHNIGESVYVFNALSKGDIDVYPEYTGTILAQHLSLPVLQTRNTANHSTSGINALLDKKDRHPGLRFIGRMGVNNPYVMVMLKSRAEELGLKAADGVATLEELGRVSRTTNLVLGSSYGFFHRADGYPGLVKEYAMSFDNDPEFLNHQNKISALVDGEIDVTDFYGTDPILHGNDQRFLILSSSPTFFPDYWLGPLLRKDFADENPNIVKALASLKGVTNGEMAELIQTSSDAGLSMDTLSRSVTAQATLHDIVQKFAKEKSLFD